MRLRGISLPDQHSEVVVSRDDNRVAIHRAVRSGRLRKLAPRVYTTNLKDSPEKIVRANCWAIAGALFPHALISDRTALEQRPAVDGSVFLITDSRTTDLELPGIAFRPRRGHPPIEGYDMPFLAGLWMSSQARALMDNLRSTRRRNRVRGTLTRRELEEFIDKILRNSGELVLNKLRDQAREIAPRLGMVGEAEKLSAIIGAMLGTQDAPLSTDVTAFRILSAALRRAHARKPEYQSYSRKNGLGYNVDLESVSVAEENIFYNYDDSEPASVTFHLSNEGRLTLYFPEKGACLLFADGARGVPKSPATFKQNFNCSIGFVPILGPVEHNEQLFEKEAARLALYNYTASRNFRNIWHYYPERFEEFRELLRTTWLSMDIESLSKN